MAVKLDYDSADLAMLAEPLVLMQTEHRTLTAPNRIAYQPMEGNDADPVGAPGPLTLARYRERARGGAGIDFVEALAVSPEARARGDQLILNATTRRAFERLVEEYRSVNPTTPLLFQLTHSGRFASDPVTPYPLTDQEARLLTDADLDRIQGDLVTANRIAFECGADGIDFKHCHGYLFGALLGKANRARANWRFGGEALEERARFFVETLERMMEAVPRDRFLYTVRLSAFEGIPGGFGSRDAESAEEDESCAELKSFVRLAVKAGVQLLNQSSGVPDRTPLLVRQTNENPLGFFDHQRRAAVIKQAVDVPVVGSGYSYLKAGNNKLPEPDRARKNIVYLGAKALREGVSDLIGIGRQSLSDPGFARKLLSGRTDRIRWDTSCNQCAVSLRSGIPAGCVTYDRYYTARFKELKQRGA